jgi:hypothetical protein
VVLDSSVIERAQGNLSNNEWAPLIRAATLGYCSVAIPAVVLAEVIAHRKRALAKQRDDLRRDVRRGRRSAEDLEQLRALLDEHDDGLQRMADAYGDQVLSTCGQEASVLAYPSVRHEELVNRVLTYRRPFNESERGYRDALIWYSILEQAADARVVILTGNTKDFADSDGQLGPDLLADVDRLGLDPEDVRLARNVAEALEIVRPASELFPDADSTWKAWLLGEDGLSVLNEILDRWQGVPIWSIPDDIPQEAWDIGLLEVQRVLNVEHATTLPSTDPEISNASAVVTAEGVISGWEWPTFPSSLDGSLWTEGSVADLFRYNQPRKVQFAISARLLPSGDATDVYLSDVRFLGGRAPVAHEQVARRMRATVVLLRAAGDDGSIAADLIDSPRAADYAEVFERTLQQFEHLADRVPGRFTVLALDNLATVLDDVAGLKALATGFENALAAMTELE